MQANTGWPWQWAVYGGTQRPPPQKLTPLFPRKLTPLFPHKLTPLFWGKSGVSFWGKEWSQFLGRWPLCTTVAVAAGGWCHGGLKSTLHHRILLAGTLKSIFSMKLSLTSLITLSTFDCTSSSTIATRPTPVARYLRQ